MRANLLTLLIFSIIFLFGPSANAQRFAGRLSIEIKMLDSNEWKSFSSKDCMTILDYKEGYFKFEIEAGKVFNKNGKFENQEFLEYIEGTETSPLNYYGTFAPESNYMFQRPTQNIKGEFDVPSGIYRSELIIRTTLVGNDERRMQLMVEKQLTSPPLREGRQVAILIDGIISRID